MRTDYDWQKTDVGAVNYKGSNREDLDEMYDRRMKTDFNRLSLRLDSQDINTGSVLHKLSFRTSVSRHDFKNINVDSINIAINSRQGKGPDVFNYAIQRPIRTNHLFLSMLDNIVWNDTFGSNVGIRYDYYNLKPHFLLNRFF